MSGREREEVFVEKSLKSIIFCFGILLYVSQFSSSSVFFASITSKIMRASFKSHLNTRTAKVHIQIKLRLATKTKNK